MPDIHLPVNWTDGMKISKKHFVETQNFIYQQSLYGAALTVTDFNFGILSGKSHFDIHVSCDINQMISAELRSCQAVTRSGVRIAINPEQPVKVTENFKNISAKFGLPPSQPQSLYLLLSVNLFNQVPVGDVSDELPHRHSYTQPDMQLSITPVDFIDLPQLESGLVVGKIGFENNELKYDDAYIPPCAAIASLPLMTSWYEKFQKAQESWEQSLIKIIQKLGMRSQQSTPLTGSIQAISTKMLEQFVSQKVYYRSILKAYPPVFLYELLLRNVQLLFTLLQCLPEKEREEILNYFAEWNEIKSGTIENQMLDTLQVSYNHYDTDRVFTSIYTVYNTLVQLFAKLSQLEYIGKRKGQNIFVIEQEAKPTKPVQQEKPNSRWSPLT